MYEVWSARARLGSYFMHFMYITHTITDTVHMSHQGLSETSLWDLIPNNNGHTSF